MIKEPLKKHAQKKYPSKKVYQPVKQVKKNRYADILGLAIIILLGIIIYSNSFQCSFHFDDLPRIVNNPNIRNLVDVKAWWNSYPMRPVGMFTFALNYHFNKLDVFGYHLVNLIIHLINACLVWWLTLLIFSSPALKDNPVTQQKKIIAFLTALLFVSHPLTTQSVTYIVQRMASLVTMFYFLSIALYLKARLAGKGKTSTYLLFAGSLISAVLAMLTKENAFTLPFAIVLFELFFLQTKKRTVNFRDYRVVLLIAALLGIIIIIPLKFSFSIFKPIPPSLGNTYTITPLNYLFTQFSVIIKYIQLLFLPINQTFEYDFPISNSFFEIRTMLCFVILLSVIILAILSFKKYRIISFGIFWFFLTLSIESSFIPIADVIYEHRTYLPSFGFFLILSSGIFFFLWNKNKYFAIIILVIIIGSNSFLTYERNKVWKDTFTFLSDIILKSPNKARPIGGLGDYYKDLGKSEMAIADYSRAIAINPKYTEAYINRGIIYGNMGKWNEAISDYSKAVEIDPKSDQAYYDRGNAYRTIGKWDKAIADYSRAIAINRKYSVAYSNRGIVKGNMGKWNEAITDYSKAIEIDPKSDQAHYNRGIAYRKLGQWDKAIADYSKAIEINPKFKEAFTNRGVAYSNLEQWDKAVEDFTKALEIDPNFTIASTNRDFAYEKLRSEKKK